jgi:hypothetical protein
MTACPLLQFDTAKVRKIQMQNNTFPKLFFGKIQVFYQGYLGVCFKPRQRVAASARLFENRICAN